MARTETATLQLLLLSISCYIATTAVVSGEQKPSLDDVISDTILSDAYESKVLKQPTEKLLDVPWWPTFITNMINTFNRESLSEMSQFGFIYMACITDLDQEFNAHFYPHDNDGRPVIEADKLISPDIKMFGNYVVSSPDEVTDGTIYAEGMLLDHIDELWNAYQRRFKQTPNFILHYSRIQPGKASTTSIVNRMSRPPFDKVAYKVVAYTLAAENVLRDPKLMANKGKGFSLKENLVVYHQQCVGSEKREESLENYARVLEKDGSLSLTDAVKLLRKSLIDDEKNMEPDNNSEMGTCQLDDSLQGCLSNCIDELLSCNCTATKKRTSIASIINEFTFSCARSDFGKCTHKWVEDNIGHDDACINKKNVQNMLVKCTPKCSGKPLSNPLDPKDPISYPDVLSVFSNLANFKRPEPSDLCSDGNGDQMKRGYGIKSGYTAGNTPCRYGHSCETHGYSYEWCYTSFSSNWDYCCTSYCGSYGWSYEWCHSGASWQKCGGGRTQTNEGKQCISAYLCGLHRDVSGSTTTPWCYIDYNKNNWEYC